LKFRKITKGEAEKVKEELSIPKSKVILIGEAERREVFITTKEVYKTLKKINKEPYTVGVIIGEFRRNKFFPNLEGAKFAKYKKIYVNDKAEQLVLYGRDVFPNSIIKGEKLKPKEKCIIVNKKGEILAIGKVEKDKIKNIIDRGWYLRKGG